MPAVAVAQQLSFKEQSFTFPASTEQLVIAKVNGDNLNDIITVIDDRLRIYFQREDGFDFLDEGRVVEAAYNGIVYLANGVTSTWSAGEFNPERIIAQRNLIES